MVGLAQRELGEGDGVVEADLALDAERLQGEAAAEAADQPVGAEADARVASAEPPT